METVGRPGWLVEQLGRSWSMKTGRQSDIGQLAVVVGHIAAGRTVHIVEHIEQIGQQRSGEQFG